jgi:hypothetical protein
LKNASLAAQRYPERRAPSDMIFKRLEGQLRANWPPVQLSKQRVATDEEHEIPVLQIVEDEPHVGHREVTNKRSSVFKFCAIILPILSEEIDLHRRQNMGLQQDGEPHHFYLYVRHYLNTVYANKWIGRGSINPWPPSPYITPLDYFLPTKHLSIVEISNIE